MSIIFRFSAKWLTLKETNWKKEYSSNELSFLSKTPFHFLADEDFRNSLVSLNGSQQKVAENVTEI